MIVWRGFGIAVIGITFAVALLMELGLGSLFAEPHYYETHGWPKFMALAVAAGLVWIMSSRLDRHADRAVVDLATGQEVIVRRRHHLFFVPLRFWPGILLAGGVAMFLFG